MKINEEWATRGNFGDYLNGELWPALFENFSANNHSVYLTGIGTIITTKNDSGLFEAILGSGADPERGPVSHENRKFYCVRGPLTQKFLGLDESKAAIDPGYLYSMILGNQANDTEKPYEFGFMPHYQTCNIGKAAMSSICSKNGIHYISPLQPPSQVVREIRKCKHLITEALHGAVVADSLNIPWTPVTTNKLILEFKWVDFCESLGLQYMPTKLPQIRSSQKFLFSHRLKKTFFNLGIGKKKWATLCPKNSSHSEFLAFEQQLTSVKETGKYILSDSKTRNSSLNNLFDAIRIFALDNNLKESKTLEAIKAAFQQKQTMQASKE